MNHTPGPWKAKVDAQPVPFKRETRYGAIEIWPADQRFAKVAKLLPQDDMAMTRANASLISAAPDLLAELIAQKEWMEQFVFIPGAPQALGEYRLKTAQNRYNKLCAAIAKAKGR